MAPLPDHFDLEETFAKIDSPHEPRIGQKPNRLQRIENLPPQQQLQQQQGQYQHPALGKATPNTFYFCLAIVLL